MPSMPGSMARLRREASLAPLIAAGLAACGGGGGSSSSPERPVPTGRTQLSGRVFDGPVENASVYLDTNRNGIIDEGDVEIGTTNAQGAYAGEVDSDVADAPLIADLSRARDTDAPTQPLTGVWRAPEESTTISPLTEWMVRHDLPMDELAGRTGLPIGWDATQFDPFANILQTQIYIEQVLAAGRFAFEQLGEASLPDIVQLELDVHENHPRNKPIFYSGGELELTTSYGDNALFEVRDNRLWFKESPDFENSRDDGNDNVYKIEFTRTIDGEQVTTQLSITVNDIALERLTSDPNSGVRARTHQRGDYDEADLPSLAAQQLMSTRFWDSPDSGPLILTWSIDDRGPSDELKTYASEIFSDETRNAIKNQAQLDAVRSLFQRAFTELEGIANIKFVEVDVNAATGQIGDLNIHVASNMERVTFGFGQFPANDHSDIFISSRIADTDWLDITSLDDFNFFFADHLRNGTLHEISHALGLSHPFDEIEDWPGDEDLRLSPDTFMSYRRTLDHVVRGAKAVDIVALQWLYGPAGEDGMGAESLNASMELV